MNPVATIALILIAGLWAIVASSFLIWSICCLVGALRASSFVDRTTKPTKNRRERRRRSK